MEFSGFIFLIPLQFYLSIFNLIITVILNSGICILFYKGGTNQRINYYRLFYVENYYLYNNIFFISYWKRKKEFVSYLTYLIPSIINLFIIFIYIYKEKDKSRFYFSYLIITLPFIYLFASNEFIFERIGFYFLLLSCCKCIFLAYFLMIILRLSQSSLELIVNLCFIFCYGGWFLFGLIIGDIFSLISNGLLFLFYIYFFIIRCLTKRDNSNENENNEEEYEQELVLNDDE